jgi:hypothetical protein
MTTIKWNGRNAEDAINQALFTQVRDNVAKQLRASRCPVHGTGPTSVTVKGQDLKTLHWDATGCCDQLIEGMRRSLS